MPRFVVLEHDHPSLHWDMMLEDESALATWRLAAPPSEGRIEAEWTFPHRPKYLDYEGPVSRGRGTVFRWDKGQFEWLERSTDTITFRWHGSKVAGTARLQRINDKQWIFELLGPDGDGSSAG